MNRFLQRLLIIPLIIFIVLAYLTLYYHDDNSSYSTHFPRNYTADTNFYTDSAGNFMMKTDIMNDSIINQYPDSGHYSGKIKEGLWTEYSLDTSNKNVTVHGEGGLPTMKLGSAMLRDFGNYVNGNKEGKWTEYRTQDPKTNFWTKYSESEYKNGLKNGKEIVYEGDKVAFILVYKDGILVGGEKK